MSYYKMPVLFLLFLIITGYSYCFYNGNAFSKETSKPGHAKNIILFIGDGMGYSDITIARNYSVGASGKLAMDRLKWSGGCTTYSVREEDPTLPDYVTDSAASGTAWATGFKTSNGRISTSPGTNKDLDTILEKAQKAGFATGVVTTADITDATPAVLASHVNHRDCRAPEEMDRCPKDKRVNGGPGSIAEQEVDHHLDVLFGGGRDRFNQIIKSGKFKGMTVEKSAEKMGYKVVTDSSGLKALKPGQKVLGLFAPSDMSTDFVGKPATPYPGSGPQKCREGLRPVDEPSLADMTVKSIEVLENKGDKKGFFLQVEGASIDKSEHDSNPCQQIGETVAFDRAVDVGLRYAEDHPETLVIVTADHAHSSQLVPEPTEKNHSPGSFTTLITADGVKMTVNYATNLPGKSQKHTGSQVHIAAEGPFASVFSGLIDNTDIFHIMVKALGIEK